MRFVEEGAGVRGLVTGNWAGARKEKREKRSEK
jgi:hypothetical protein